jgi:hypothetical protein
MVSPLGVLRGETVIQAEGRKQADLKGEVGSELVDDLPWGEASLVGIGTSQVEIELVKGSLGHEFGTVVESFQSKELILDEARNGLDVALIGVSAGRDALVLRAEESDGVGEVRTGAVGLQLADELAAVVGLPGHVPQVDAPAPEMLLHALGEEFAGLGGASGSVSEELEAAAHVAGGVLDRR